MKFVTSLLLFAGYTLVYGAVANHGEFAWTPWKGLFADAYTGGSGGGGNSPQSNSQQQPGGGNTQQTTPPAKPKPKGWDAIFGQSIGPIDPIPKIYDFFKSLGF